jgi:two-component system, NtrC family, response regulator AtoC
MASKGTVLIAEDEKTARLALAELLELHQYRVLAVEDGQSAFLEITNRSLDAILLDVRMPGLDGLSILRRMQQAAIDTPVIVMTAFGDSDTVIEAMRLGAFDYLSKPLDLSQVLEQLGRAISRKRISQSSVLEEKTALARPQTAPMMVGHSPAMQHVYKMIGQVAGSEATVMVRGESGTGKELVVNAIHHNSSRAKGPLIKVNCAAIPETLLESELFGHEKGAFTNATYRRVGRFEEANGGTLFLDEIGELAPALQSKLLRAIQERTIERLGSNTPHRVDIRLITATARNLEQAVGDGLFREDLYYRLNVVVISLPPLRERKQDIPALVEHFLRRAAHAVTITPAALNLLCDYNWPGNIRELENTVERAVVLARSGLIDQSDIHFNPNRKNTEANWTDQIPLEDGWKTNVAVAEKAMVIRALRVAEGNKSRAAELLKIHRRLLYEKLREYGLEDSV